MATTKGFNPPGEIVLEGNLSETWARWKKEFMVYLTASESKSKPDDVKTCRLLSAIGPKAREIYYTFTFEEEDDAMKFDNVVERFDQYFTPKKNVTYMRYKFFSCNQSEGQNIDAYVTELRKRAEHCEFAELKNSLTRDKIVIGICDKKTQERLLREYELSLEKALQICRATEEIKIQTDEMAGSSESTKKIDHVHSKSHRPGKGSNKHRPNSKQVERSNWSPPDRKRQCLKCLKCHDPAKCPAYNQKCHKCGHLGHYAVACRSKSGKKVRQVLADKEQSTEFYIGTMKADIVNVNCERDTDITDHTASTDTVISGDNKSETMSTQNNVDETENEHTDILSTEDNKQESTNAGVHNEETLNKLWDEPGVHEQDPDNNDDELFVAAIDDEGLDDVAQSQWQLPLLTSGTYVTYTLDTGAMCNVLPQNVYNLLEKRPKLHKTKVKLSSYGGESIPVVEKVIARIQKGQNKS